jgi:hypothetical protein
VAIFISANSFAHKMPVSARTGMVYGHETSCALFIWGSGMKKDFWNTASEKTNHETLTAVAKLRKTGIDVEKILDMMEGAYSTRKEQFMRFALELNEEQSGYLYTILMGLKKNREGQQE